MPSRTVKIKRFIQDVKKSNSIYISHKSQNLSWESQKRVKTEVLARKSQKSEFLKAKIVPLLDCQHKCCMVNCATGKILFKLNCC